MSKRRLVWGGKRGKHGLARCRPGPCPAETPRHAELRLLDWGFDGPWKLLDRSRGPFYREIPVSLPFSGFWQHGRAWLSSVAQMLGCVGVVLSIRIVRLSRAVSWAIWGDLGVPGWRSEKGRPGQARQAAWRGELCRIQQSL